MKKISKANTENDPLSALVVFDRLEVGPVKLEPKRLVAPYRLVTGGNTEQTELIYTYEEAVFRSRHSRVAQPGRYDRCSGGPELRLVLPRNRL